MSRLKQLSSTDTLFVAGESTTLYNHTAGLLVLDARGRRNFNFETFRARMIERLDLVPQFRWKLHEVPLALDLPYWVDDPKFSYGHHIKRIAVPAPGDIRTLSDIAGHLFSKHMDRGKPLWEAWFIEGLPGGRYAVMLKLHHCMMDGQGAVKLMEILCDLEPDAPPRPVPDAIAKAEAGDMPTTRESTSRAYRRLAGLPIEIGKTALELVTPRLISRLSRKKPAVKPAGFSPHPMFNGDIGVDRGFVFGSLSLDDIKLVKNHFGVSLNEVVLAVVGGALRDYLLAQDELPEQSLRTSMPVSLRSGDDEDFSNRVTTIMVTLATDIADHEQRLCSIHDESARAKGRARSGAKGITEILGILPPLAVAVLTRGVDADQAAQILGSNLAVSNVRGSPVPVYLGGTRVESLYPMSVIAPGMALNITCVSYGDKLDFGLTLDPDVIPDAWSLMTCLEAVLVEYVALAGGRKKPKRKAVRRKASTAKVKRRRVS